MSTKSKRGPVPSAPPAPPASEPDPAPPVVPATLPPANLATIDLPQSETTSIEFAQQMRAAVLELIRKVFVKDQHYGRIPGCDRDILLQPGAQAICWLFNVAAVPQPRVTDHDDGHRTWEGEVLLMHRVTGRQLAVGMGVCSTMEGKYASRRAQRTCPRCKAAAIIQPKSGPNPGGFWCAPNKGGCGADFKPSDPALRDQDAGRVAHGNPADHYNTCAKMWFKRSMVHGAINLSGCSDLFTQDLDETPPVEQSAQTKPAPQQAQPRQPAPQQPRSAPPGRPAITKVSEPGGGEVEIVALRRVKSGTRSDGQAWELVEIHMKRDGATGLGSVTSIDDAIVAAARYAHESKQRAQCSWGPDAKGYITLLSCNVQRETAAVERRFVPDPQ